MTTFWTILSVLALLYVVTATVLLFSAKFKKNEKGNLILDPGSWHFKLTHPLLTRKFSLYDIKRNPAYFDLPSNICPYAIEFFLMLYIGWPVLIIWLIFKTVLYLPFMIMFGFYPIADIVSMLEWGGNPFTVNVGKISLPKIGKYKIFPIHIILLATYAIGWFYNPSLTLASIIWVLSVAGGVSTIIGLGWFYNWVKKTDQKEVSLAREWLSANKNKVCWKLELPPAD